MTALVIDHLDRNSDLPASGCLDRTDSPRCLTLFGVVIPPRLAHAYPVSHRRRFAREQLMPTSPTLPATRCGIRCIACLFCEFIITRRVQKGLIINLNGDRQA